MSSRNGSFGLEESGARVTAKSGRTLRRGALATAVASLGLFGVLSLFGGALVVSACSSPDTDARIDPVPAGPDRATFKPVAVMLVRRCGSLDCHGAQDRNMRLYGYGGRRLDPGDVPDGPPMTDAERDADYDAVVSVEPEKLPGVIASKGATADDLTLVRKARGEEAHKGGQRIAVGDDADKCLISWFAGAVDTDACLAANSN